jgi:hypothetical protein
MAVLWGGVGGGGSGLCVCGGSGVGDGGRGAGGRGVGGWGGRGGEGGGGISSAGRARAPASGWALGAAPLRARCRRASRAVRGMGPRSPLFRRASGS